MANVKGNLTAYKNWAPDGVLWTEWAKPVLFAGHHLGSSARGANLWDMDLQDRKKALNSRNAPEAVEKPADVIPKINWIDSVKADTAIILDLPGKRGVLTGLALARMGYRPVPLYNGVNVVHSNGKETVREVVVRTWEIADALIRYAPEIPALPIDDEAPPVFMLDTNRIGNGVNRADLKPGVYDNRWRVFKQDMPSAAFLLKHGIKTVIAHSDGSVIECDLDTILFQYQKQGLVIRHYDGKNPVKVIRVENPSAWGRVISRAAVTAGLMRNAAGGFGGVIPEESSSGGG